MNKRHSVEKYLFMIMFLAAFSSAQDWAQVGNDIDGEAAWDASGYSVSLSADGSRVAIGAPHNIGVNGTDSGQTRVFDYNTVTDLWDQVGGDIDGEAADDLSGNSVSLSADGSRVAVGAPWNDNLSGVDAGQVRVYDYNGIAWVQVGDDIDGEAASDFSGTTVSLSADGIRVIISANMNDGVNGVNSGHARVYEYDGFAWIQIGGDLDGEAAGDQFGQSNSISEDGTRVAVGTTRNTANGAGTNIGHVRIFEYLGGVWVQIGDDIDGEAEADDSGHSISLSADGTRIAIGAAWNDGINGDGSGHIRVYEDIGGVWTQVGADIDGEAAGDNLGYSVSLSADGTRVASGAPFNNGNGEYSGHTRVYDYLGGVWTQVGTDIDGEAAWDWSGESVSLSGDGTRVGIGASWNAGASGLYPGHTRVYELDQSLPVELALFTVESTLDGVLCSWITESEIENIGFFLERRTDGEKWQEIASYKTDENLIGQGTTSFPTEYEYIDRYVVPNTSYEYRLADVDYSGNITYHNPQRIRVEDVNTENIIGFILLPAYPNPFNPTTTITYILEEDQNVKVRIYDMLGNHVTTLVDMDQKPGWHKINWDGTDDTLNKVPTGIYICKVTTNRTTKSIKLVLLK